MDIHDIARMKKRRVCQWCGRHLEKGNQGATCYRCQEKLEGILDRHLELVNIALTVKQAALQLNLSQGHIRRILEHPEKYPWRYYGITEAYKPGKEWRIFRAPLEHRKELSRQLMDIGQGALNWMKVNVILGLGPVLTSSDMRDLLECQITPLPRRKTPRERAEQAKRLRQDPERFVDQFFDAIVPIVKEKLSEMELLRPIASTGQQPRSASAGPEHQHQPN